MSKKSLNASNWPIWSSKMQSNRSRASLILIKTIKSCWQITTMILLITVFWSWRRTLQVWPSHKAITYITRITILTNRFRWARSRGTPAVDSGSSHSRRLRLSSLFSWRHMIPSMRPRAITKAHSAMRKASRHSMSHILTPMPTPLVVKTSMTRLTTSTNLNQL